jgi:hypothetical protein
MGPVTATASSSIWLGLPDVVEETFNALAETGWRATP